MKRERGGRETSPRRGKVRSPDPPRHRPNNPRHRPRPPAESPSHPSAAPPPATSDYHLILLSARIAQSTCEHRRTRVPRNTHFPALLLIRQLPSAAYFPASGCAPFLLKLTDESNAAPTQRYRRNTVISRCWLAS